MQDELLERYLRAMEGIQRKRRKIRRHWWQFWKKPLSRETKELLKRIKQS